MFKKTSLRQIQAIVYVLLIALLYAALDQQIINLEQHLPVYGTSEDAAVEHVTKEPNNKTESQYDILIDLTESMLYLFENNKLIKKYPVAQGKPETPSPIGVWYIVNKARNWGGGFGTRWMGLNVPWGTYGIHGTNRPSSIGNRASHGCFRMRNRDVEELYSIVPFKTRVIVYGGPYGNMGSTFDKLEPGDRKSQVAEVQKRLQKLGYYTGAIDGIYGEGMKAALLKFKKDNNLPLTHYVDWATYKALGIFPFE
ncbi:MAG TPA: L,D-transpeptidase family protein [Clostridiales bacterium]|nr:L,D-transpeptidase family protein [Clostridiales bacterium]